MLQGRGHRMNPQWQSLQVLTLVHHASNDFMYWKNDNRVPAISSCWGISFKPLIRFVHSQTHVLFGQKLSNFETPFLSAQCSCRRLRFQFLTFQSQQANISVTFMSYGFQGYFFVNQPDMPMISIEGGQDSRLFFTFPH